MGGGGGGDFYIARKINAKSNFIFIKGFMHLFFKKP
jgi:hypothetical protein